MSPTLEQVQTFHTHLTRIDWTAHYSDSASVRRAGDAEQEDLKMQCIEAVWKSQHLKYYNQMQAIRTKIWERAEYGKNERLYYTEVYKELSEFISTLPEPYKATFVTELSHYQNNRLATTSDDVYNSVLAIFSRLVNALHFNRDYVRIDVFKSYKDRYMRDFFKLFPNKTVTNSHQVAVHINHVCLAEPIRNAIENCIWELRSLPTEIKEDTEFLSKLATIARMEFFKVFVDTKSYDDPTYVGVGERFFIDCRLGECSGDAFDERSGFANRDVCLIINSTLVCDI